MIGIIRIFINFYSVAGELKIICIVCVQQMFVLKTMMVTTISSSSIYFNLNVLM